ncbi:MAG: 30S ribosomal protein S21 [Clostridia bacterium]|nr:30S ribosomal protein S21 [Clostridia bacterium]
MVTVKVMTDKNGNPNLEGALRKFKKEIMKEGIMKTLEEKRYYKKPSTRKHEKKVWQDHLRKVIREQELKEGSKPDPKEKDEKSLAKENLM